MRTAFFGKDASSDNASRLVGTATSLSWAELLHGDPEAADRAIKEGLAASGDPVPFSLAVNLLHIHLFENRLAEAETLARAHLGDKTASGRSFAEVAKSDFDDLAKAGFPVPNRERIETVFAEKPGPSALNARGQICYLPRLSRFG